MGRPRAVVQLEGTTRSGYPTVWCSAEIAAYADLVAEQLGHAPLGRGRAWTLDLLAGFPQPFARLAVGKLYLADEVRPWVDHYMRYRRDSRGPVSEDVRAKIREAKGTGSLVKVGARFGVAATTVARIWSEDAE